MVLKLQVVGPDGGSNPTMEQAVRRNIFYAIQLLASSRSSARSSAASRMLAAVIMIAVSINSDPVSRQGWHDQFAGGTRVLKVG